MNFLNKFLLFNKKIENKEEPNQSAFDQNKEIAKLVKEARIKQNLTTKELSRISRIPEQTINYIENNNQKFIPKYPFLRSILMKLEQCLFFQKNTLLKLAIKGKDTLKKEKKDFIFSKFDLINTWQGTFLYFLILVLSIFVLKRYFILNVKIIEIQNIENRIIDK